jgi:putative ATPase
LITFFGKQIRNNFEEDMSDQISMFNKGKKPTNIPLAEKIRPQSIEEIMGQNKLLEEGSQLRNMIENDSYTSFILWGPPGTGKTTIARLIEKESSRRFISFSAVLSSIKDVKAVMKEAEYNFIEKNQSTILFIDEIHRFNKSQQDAFLHYIESGAVILIGATTENPSFEVIPPLLSRCNVFVLQQLSDEDIINIINRALKVTEIKFKFEKKCLPYIAELSSGDARKALNYLESIIKNTKEGQKADVAFISKILSRKAMFYDKEREEHYNVISALHKSLRGSDPQAGLYWLAPFGAVCFRRCRTCRPECLGSGNCRERYCAFFRNAGSKRCVSATCGLSGHRTKKQCVVFRLQQSSR